MNRFRLDLFRGNFDGADKNCVYDDKDKEIYEDNNDGDNEDNVR